MNINCLQKLLDLVHFEDQKGLHEYRTYFLFQCFEKLTTKSTDGRETIGSLEAARDFKMSRLQNNVHKQQVFLVKCASLTSHWTLGSRLSQLLYCKTWRTQ
jgi:hypothetical protein